MAQNTGGHHRVSAVYSERPRQWDLPWNAQDERKAWRRCDRGGFWADDDYSRCQYANDVTRVLYMFNQVTGKSSDLLRLLIRRGAHTKYISFFYY